MYTYDPFLDALLVDLVFETNASTVEIADQLETSEVEVRRRIKALGLGWVRRSRGHASRGQAALAQVMRRLVPGATIVCEEPLGDRLRLDVYCAKYKLAAEYHGRQHYQYVDHFHGDRYGWEDHQRRDEKKLQLCKDLGIALVVFRYSDDLTEDAVFGRLLHALESTAWVDPERKQTMRAHPSYEAWKERQRAYRRQAYRRMKNARGT